MQIAQWIEELDGEECLKLRGLWEEVFWEDSKEFTDYYFEEKARKNHAFCLQIGEEAVSMLYLSPYPMRIRVGDRFMEQEIYYIVGVATKEKYRHRGYMDRILKAALSFIRKKEQPFAFLMPANPNIYLPYQFTYIYDKEEYLWKGKGEICPLKEEEYFRLAEYAFSSLKKEADVFIKRDELYFRTMEKELQAQNGGIHIRYGQGGKVEGYYFYTEEEGKGEIQEAVFSCKEGLCPVYASGKRQPSIMARIVDVRAMLSLLRAKRKEVVLTILVKDSILLSNDGVWECRIGTDEALIHKREEVLLASGGREAYVFEKRENGIGFGSEEERAVFECTAGVEGLAAWVFGYQEAEECFAFFDGEDEQEVLGKLKEIKQLSHVFINEIV